MGALSIDITLPRRAFDVRAELTLSNETIALVGRSGAGKTSLLRALTGLEPATRGRIALDAEVWLDSRRAMNVPPEQRRLGYLPQDYGLFPHLSVAGNVRFAARRDRHDLLARLHLSHLAAARPAELSGGERQRVALARALARDPQVVLLDEPFAALDGLTRREVREELALVLGELRLPALLVTHAFEDASRLADRVGVLDGGEIVQLAPPGELLSRPASVLVAALTGANILTGAASGRRIRLAGGGELLSHATAHGQVDIAIHPWALELTGPAEGMFTDTVTSVHRDSGVHVVRLSGLSAQLPAGAGTGPPPPPGMLVGVRVDPSQVIVLPR